MSRRLFGGVLVVALGSAALTAGQSPQAPPIPAFRSQVTNVELVVSVAGSDGAFVRGLTAADFEVLEDGDRQAIESFAMVDLAAERASAQTPLAEPDVRSNERVFTGRVWVLALDAMNVAADRSEKVRQIARLFVERALGPDDLMAVVTIGATKGPYQDLTSSRQRLLQAIEEFAGEELPSLTIAETTAAAPVVLAQPSESGQPGPGEKNVISIELERRDHTLRAMRQLRTVADWAAGVHGRRKTIVWVSEGLKHDVTSEFNADRMDAAGLTGTAVGLQLRETAGVITRAGVNIYALDPAGLTVESAVRDRARWMGQTNLRMMAESTGGFALTNSNMFPDAIDRVVRENSTYYVLGYSPVAARQRDGRYHRIRVRVTRPGVTVRTREGYVSPRDRSEPSAFLITAAGLSPELEAIMQSPLPVSGLPLRVSAVPFKGDGARASVLLSGEIPASAFAAGQVALEVSYAAIDGTPAVRGSQTLRSLVAAGSPVERQARQAGVAFARRFELPKGRYQLRVGARDATRNVSGSVLYDLDVPDFSGDAVTMSGLVLGVTRGEQAVMLRDDGIEAALGTHPLSRRRLSAADGDAVAHVEIYDRDAAPHDVTIRTRLTSAGGATAFEDAETRRPQDAAADGGTHRYTVQVPLAAVPPGDYLLTVAAASSAPGGRTVERRIPITID